MYMERRNVFSPTAISTKLEVITLTDISFTCVNSTIWCVLPQSLSCSGGRNVWGRWSSEAAGGRGERWGERKRRKNCCPESGGVGLEIVEISAAISGGGNNEGEGRAERGMEGDRKRKIVWYQLGDVFVAIGRGGDGWGEGFQEGVMANASGSCKQETQQCVRGQQIRL